MNTTPSHPCTCQIQQSKYTRTSQVHQFSYPRIPVYQSILLCTSMHTSPYINPLIQACHPPFRHLENQGTKHTANRFCTPSVYEPKKKKKKASENRKNFFLNQQNIHDQKNNIRATTTKKQNTHTHTHKSIHSFPLA